jgi:hypothetical protein
MRRMNPVDALAADGRLRAYAASPNMRIKLSDAPDFWRQTRTTWRVRAEPDVGGADLVAFPACLRGAWGDALRLQEALNRADGTDTHPFAPPCAYAFFFGENLRLSPRVALGKPYALAVEKTGESLAIALSTFGDAGVRARESARAMRYALDEGVRFAGIKTRFRVESTQSVVFSGASIPPVAEGEETVLRFVSPLCLKRNGAPSADTKSLWKSLADRVESMLRWHRVGITECVPDVVARARAVPVREENLRWSVWTRRSSRKKGEEIPMYGFSCDLVFAGRLSPEARTLLRLGQECGAGSYTGFGLGRYRVLSSASP